MVPPPDPVRATDDGIEIDVQVAVRSSRTRIVGSHGDRIRIQLAAPPVDGAANEELVTLVAKTLKIPKRDVTLVRGTTSKRKTVFARGLDVARARSLLGLAGLLVAGIVGGCQPITTEVDIQLVLPEDSEDLEATNNVTVRLSPNGFEEAFATTGLDFALEVELDPDDEERRLSVFLARGPDELLAWGRSPLFTYGSAGAGMAVFVARPDRLSTFPLAFDLPDATTLAAYARGRGIVALGGDGSTLFVNELTLQATFSAPLDSDRGLPDPDDGALVGDALGGVQRLSWNDGLSGFRYDVGADAWIDLPLDGAVQAGVRNGAAHFVDVPGEQMLLFGGGDHTDVVAVSLVPTDGDEVRTVDGWTLDGPRHGATASALVRQGTDEGETTILFGGDDPALPAVFLVTSGISLGPTDAWTGGRCVQLDEGGAEATLRVLCGGGVRGGTPTADAVLVTIPAAGSPDAPTAQEQPALLPTAMADPRWLRGPDAVYAQGAGRLIRVETADLAATGVEDVDAPRTTGGCSVTLSTGATFLVGGVDAGDMPVTTWQVFVPTPS